ncbi:MAG TPA: hypothetical protein VKQ28_17480 [Candidatus Acidoferrum sp.]|nr:hypothetical protein [Candidatus Acidoferrum sp.]
MPYPKSESEEFLKLGNNELIDTVIQSQETCSNFYTLCGSVVERYKVGELAFHFHCFTNATGTRSDCDLCIMAARSISDMNALSAFRGSYLSASGMGTENSQQQPPMLIDIAQCVEENERVGWTATLPNAVRLQSLDFCNRVWGNPVKPMPPKLVIESIRRRTDRKHILFAGDVVRGKYQFPHQIVECGPQVLEKVTNNERNSCGHGSGNLHPKADAASLSLFLGHHNAGFRLKIPISFGYERLVVAFDPEDFLSN